MAKTDFPLNIDRRRLLVGAAALPAASMVSVAKRAEALSPIGAAQPLSPPSPFRALNVSAATARRLLEIAQRNEIRQEAGLPLLQVVQELRKMKRRDDLEEFERFAAGHREAILEGLLRSRREAQDNRHWRPCWMEVVRYQNDVREILREQFKTTRRLGVTE